MRRRRRSWGRSQGPLQLGPPTLQPYVRIPCVGGPLDGEMMGFRPPVPGAFRVGRFLYYLTGRQTPKGSWLISFFEREELRSLR